MAEAQNDFNVSGSGVVAMIDTGVDVHHPALQGSLLPESDLHEAERKRRNAGREAASAAHT